MLGSSSPDRDCIFCRLLDGRAPAAFVYRDDRCAAFMDIQPVNEGHLLVIPNEHLPSLKDLDGETAAQLMRVACQLAVALRASGLRCEGVNLFLADGEAAGQEVMHLHLHLFPRYWGDGFGLRRRLPFERPSRAELERTAQQIRQALAGFLR